MTLSITPVYAALLALVFLVLSFRVIFVRMGAKVSYGDGENPTLQVRIRAHANFAEYTPLVLLLLLIAELLGGHALLLHAMGLMLLVGRVAHAVGFNVDRKLILLREAGMVLTFSALLIGAIANLWLALF